jgi:ribonuclease J
VHGTPRHLAANAALGRASHVPVVTVVANGDLCRLAGPGVEVIDKVVNGRLSVGADGRLARVPPDVLAAMRTGAH